MMSILDECSEIKGVWNHFPQFSLETPQSRSPLEALFSCLQRCPERLEELMTVAWGLWQRRNSLVFELKRFSPSEAVDHALTLCADFREAHSKTLQPSSILFQWRPSEPRSWKLNVNGAIFPDYHRAGVGLILRDDLRRVTATITQPETHTAEPLGVELLAIFLGLQFCVPLGISSIIVETDCLLAGPWKMVLPLPQPSVC